MATAGNRVTAYSEHWERMYAGSTQSEWHATWADIKVVLIPYLQQAAACTKSAQKWCKDTSIQNNLKEHLGSKPHKPGCVIDVGCGASTLGLQLFCGHPGFANLLLIDAAPALLHKLQMRPDTNANVNTQDIQAIAAAPSVNPQLLASDCRSLPLQDGCAAVVLDKGTMDALWSDQDKVAMLQECTRVIQKPYGIFVSISFSSPARLSLLQEHCHRLGMQMHTHVIGEGDPAKGFDVRFLTVIAQNLSPVPYTPSNLTTLVLKRLKLTGSLLDSSFDDCDDNAMCPASVASEQVHLPSLFD